MDKTFSPRYSPSRITYAEAVGFSRFRFHRKRPASSSCFHIPVLKYYLLRTQNITSSSLSKVTVVFLLENLCRCPLSRLALLIIGNLAGFYNLKSLESDHTPRPPTPQPWCWFVGHRFLKQAKNRASDWSLWQCGRVLISSPLSPFQAECETYPSREHKNAALFANRISWRKSLRSQKSPPRAQQKCYKKVWYSGTKSARNILTNFKPEPGLTRKTRPDLQPCVCYSNVLGDHSYLGVANKLVTSLKFFFSKTLLFNNKDKTAMTNPRQFHFQIYVWYFYTSLHWHERLCLSHRN